MVRPVCRTSAGAYLTAAQHDAHMFSMLTRQELLTFWERAILPLVFTALGVGFPAHRVNDPSKPDAIANGQFILIRRDVYGATGGHAAVRERIDEDRALAQTVSVSIGNNRSKVLLDQGRVFPDGL
ncbi:MAG: hypothetical protein R6X17_12575, partial [Candidatus Competibacteraceae bacterium]